MYHSECRSCGQGHVGFWFRDQDGSVVLLCKACGLWWTDPVLVGSALEGQSTSQISKSSTSPGDQPGHWATLGEIIDKGWFSYIEGGEDDADEAPQPPKEKWVHSLCAGFCEGLIAFWRCGEDGTVVLLCDECGHLWMNPASVGNEDCLSTAGHPEFQLPGGKVLLGDPPCRWATREEIEQRGWSQFINLTYLSPKPPEE